MLPAEWSRIPADLTDYPQWVTWRRVSGRKVPYCAKTGKPASTTNPSTWGAIEFVVSRLVVADAGIGFVFSDKDPFTGIDLDDCILPDGSIKPWARPILESMPTYAEVSPSGTGIKLWVRAKVQNAVKTYVDANGKPCDEASADGAIEVYCWGRYFTVTGQAWNNAPAEIEDCQKAVEVLLQWLRPARNGHHKPSVIEMPDKIPPGNRHQYLLRVAARLRHQGFDEVLLRPTLSQINAQRCDPPKPEAELEGIVHWVCQKPAGMAIKIPPANQQTISTTTDEKPEAAEPEVFLPREDHDKPVPNDIARLIMRDHVLLIDSRRGETLYEYTGRYWEPITKQIITGYALTYDTHEHTSNRKRSEAASYVLASVIKRKTIKWQQLGEAEIAFQNGVLDVVTNELRPHRPSDYLETIIPHDYTPTRNHSRWERALEEWFSGDRDGASKIDAIQEFFGYILLPHARYKKCLFLHGEPDSGKSKVLDVISLMVGESNICSIPTEDMEDARKLSPILGKMVNLLGELPAAALVRDGGFKKLVSTGDTIQIDPKYKDAFPYIPFCKHVIACNTMPTVSDTTRATWNRVLLVRFNNAFTSSRKNVDKNLLQKLEAEISGIVAWAVEGAFRLIQQGGDFTEVAESEQEIVEHQQVQNPLYNFLEEKAELLRNDDGSIDDRYMIQTEELRSKFEAWLHKNVSHKYLADLLRSCAKLYNIDHPKAFKSVSVYSRELARTVRCIVGLKWL